jgi:hypothetical protein
MSSLLKCGPREANEPKLTGYPPPPMPIDASNPAGGEWLNAGVRPHYLCSCSAIQMTRSHAFLMPMTSKRISAIVIPVHGDQAAPRRKPMPARKRTT